MPTYDYECKSCGHRFELFQSITAKPLKKCAGCGRQTAKRLIGTGAGIIFKGSGFYQTDYRSDGYKKAAKADTESSSGTKTDKPAESPKPAVEKSPPAKDSKPKSGDPK
jgi:putative FmdB family regulatory protein